MDRKVTQQHRSLPLSTPTDLGENATSDVATALTALLADVFALY
ncbi:DNA starvation/stationary phase protection protein, partial [Rhizobium johnstonii]